MHSSSLVVLTVISSAFAIPLATRDVAKLPVDIDAPVKALVGVGAKVVAPINAAVGNVDASYINALNGVGSGNKINARHGDVVHAPVDVFAPAKVVAGVVANAKVPVNAAVANVKAENIKGLNSVASGNKINARGGPDVVKAPIDVTAPVKAVVGAAAKVVAPVNAAVANVGLENVNVANNVLSGNKIGARDVVKAPVDVYAPVKAVVGAAAKVVAPVNAAVANVKADKVNVANDVLSGNKLDARDVVHAPVDVFAPVKAVVGVAAKVTAPVNAAVANVKADKVNVANDVLSGNKVGPRHDVVAAPVEVIAPVKALVGAAAKVAAPVNAAVGNVDLEKVNVANNVLSGNKVHA